MKNEPFEMKQYLKTMNLADARTMFSIQMKTTRTIKSHYMSDKKFATELWKCPEKCDRIDSIEHVAYACPHYEHLKVDRDIQNNDFDLVHFFQDVIQLRDVIIPSCLCCCDLRHLTQAV